MLDIQVELFGLARLICGRREVGIRVPVPARPSDIAAALSDSCPDLIDKVVRDDRSGLQESYTFNLNGTAFLGFEEVRLSPGDRILLFSSQAGG